MMPSSRARAVTPQGRVVPQRAAGTPTSTAASRAPTAPVTSAGLRRGAQRGVTPIKRTIAAQFGLNSNSPSASVPAGSSAGLPPDFAFTVAQELKVLERIERGEFTRGVGLEQFLPLSDGTIPPFNVDNNGKPKFQQNLMHAFETSEIQGGLGCSRLNSTTFDNRHGHTQQVTSTSNDLWSMGDSGRVEQTGDFKFNSTPDLSHQSSESLGPTESTIDDDQNNDTQESETSSEENSHNCDELPDYIKASDAVVQSMDDYYDLMKRAVEAVFEARFAELFPQKHVSTLTKVEEAMNVLQKFLQQNQSQNMKLFFSSPRKGGQTIRCPVEEQDDFIHKAYKLSELMKKFHKFLKREDASLNLEGKIQQFKNIVEKLDKDINEDQACEQTIDDLIQTLKDVSKNKDDDNDDTGSSGDVLDLDDDDI